MSLEIDLQTATADTFRDMSHSEVMDALGLEYIGVFGRRGHFTNDLLFRAHLGDEVRPDSYSNAVANDDFMIFGITSEGREIIKAAVFDGQVVRPGELTSEHYMRFNGREHEVERKVAEYNLGTELTKLLNPVIPQGLVSADQNIEQISEPTKPAYPKGHEVTYTDQFMERLNTIYPIDSVLGDKKADIAERKSSTILGLVMGSPLRNAEGEDILAYILMSSAQADSWQPFMINAPQLTDADLTAEQYVKGVEGMSMNYNRGMIEGGIMFGIAKAVNKGFATIHQFGDHVVVSPTQTAVEYFQTKAQPKA